MSIPPEKWVFAEQQRRLHEAKECMAARYGNEQCAGKIVRAHIIPRARLQQIAVGGRVHAVPTRLIPVMRMQHSFFEAEDLGVGEFSVLNCFCAHHDKALFAPLEDEQLTFSREQLALLHYRAIAAEAYRRGNVEDAAAEQGRALPSDDHMKGFFYTIFQIHSLAAETAENTLKRLERIVETGTFSKIRGMIVRLKDDPVFLSVGAFRPLYDLNRQKLQDHDTAESTAYIGMHVLVADKKPAIVFTWLRGQKPAERFAKSFLAQPREHLTTLAIQMAFEYSEHTCMKRGWWLKLTNAQRGNLLRRVQRDNSLGHVRTSDNITFSSSYDDWEFDSVEFVQ